VTQASSATATDLLFGFTGRLFDSATALQNNLNRWYDANVGRWVSEDLVSFGIEEWNPLRYVSANPLIFIDPLGQALWPILVKIAVELAIWYGNYCGPGSGPGPGKGGPPPVDGLDAACENHDRCDENGGDNWWNALPGCSTPNTEKCDKILCQAAQNFNCGQVPWPRRAHCYTYRAEIIGYFC
jgi:RHS repeat-associated protein